MPQKNMFSKICPSQNAYSVVLLGFLGAAAMQGCTLINGIDDNQADAGDADAGDTGDAGENDGGAGFNECEFDNGGCSPQRECIDIANGVRCGDCPDGFTDDTPTTCVDIDECEDDNGGCSPLRECINEEGDSSCGDCAEGFKPKGARDCEDIDECLTENVCLPHEACQNIEGGATCRPSDFERPQWRIEDITTYTTTGNNEIFVDTTTGLQWNADISQRGTYEEAIDICKNANFGGVSGWRLPTLQELLTLVDYTINGVSTTIPNADAARHWSITPFAQLETEALSVNFEDGDYFHLVKSQDLAVRCVREPAPPLLAAQQYEVSESGNTVRDVQTQLIWQRIASNTEHTFDEAVTFCDGLSVDGLTDWRVPTIKELVSIAVFNTRPSIDANLFPNTSTAFFWSSTTLANDPNQVWELGFEDGDTFHFDIAGSRDPVRCVHDDIR